MSINELFTDREKMLITNALYILECQCIGDDLDGELKNEIEEAGGMPGDEEIRTIMERFEK
jgi:hypothetical protein